MSKNFYRFDVESELGKQMTKFWHQCIKADKAADNFARKFGGEGAAYYQDPNAFAGGVVYLICPKDKEINEEIWRKVSDNLNGDVVWEPNCKKRTDVLLIPHAGFRPSDTAMRIYNKHFSSWNEVKHMHTTEEWAEMAKINTHDKPINDADIDKYLKDSVFVKYIEFYGDQKPVNKRFNVAWTLKRAIETERQRMGLPTVRTEALLQLLQARIGDGKHPIVKLHTMTPTFFEYGGRYYLGTDYDCMHPQLVPITSRIYAQKMTEMRELVRMSS